MTISAINDAVASLKQLYIDSSKVEILFLDELTETIQVKFIETGLITFVTKGSISDKQLIRRYIKVDDLLILRI
ncbi:MAG TPA: hypothetical protein DCR69_00180 [Clostridium sp.]|nr:hypothetical protein [Clostridium sp.]